MSLSKERAIEKGYMDARYIVGQGKAHKCCKPHTPVFNCKMYGTFNVYIEGRLDYFQPSITYGGKNYWFTRIEHDGQEYFGWAIRDEGSHQRIKVLEILTKQRLPESLKTDGLKITVFEKWDEKRIENWAKDQYWFQDFPFSSEHRADSEFLWKIINKVDWAGQSVLDIGCHYGYFSFKASELGAHVVGMDVNNKSLNIAETIRNNIIHQDVKFVREEPSHPFDTILYLSVHHQPDPKYLCLKEKMNSLKTRANKHLFVELIMPPMFPKAKTPNEAEIDEIVDGQILTRYKHKVRGVRKVYYVDMEKTNG